MTCVDVVMWGADPTGVSDSTAAIQAAVNTLPASHGRLVFPAGRYRVSGEVILAGRTDVAVDGAGATLELAAATPSPAGAKSVFHVTGCHRFRVAGLSIFDTDRTQQYNGLRVSTSTGGVISGVRVTDVRWAGLTVYDPAAGGSRDIAVTDCAAVGTRFGISVNGHDVRIVGCHVAMYWPSTGEAGDGGQWTPDSDYWDGILVLSGSDRTVVSANTVTECGQSGIYTQDCSNLTVSGNTVTGCVLRGIEVDGAAGVAIGVSIVGNVVTDCGGNINLVRARQVTVTGNRVANNDPGRQVSGIAANIGASDVLIAANHVFQAHPTMPAVWVAADATKVMAAFNAVDGAVKYQTPPDTVVIDRDAAGRIKTLGTVIAVGGVGVGNSAAATTLGSVTRKFPVFGSSGQVIGYVPVYGSIT